MNAAAVLRQAGSAAGLSQAELAKAAGTTQAMVARYESGATSPTVRALSRLLDACGMRAEIRLRPFSDPSSRRRLVPTMAMLRERRAEIERIVGDRGGRNIGVLGSVARGDADEASDIDLLIDYDVQALGMVPLLAMATLLELELGVPVDLVARGQLSARAAEVAAHEEVPLT